MPLGSLGRFSADGSSAWKFESVQFPLNLESHQYGETACIAAQQASPPLVPPLRTAQSTALQEIAREPLPTRNAQVQECTTANRWTPETRRLNSITFYSSLILHKAHNGSASRSASQPGILGDLCSAQLLHVHLFLEARGGGTGGSRLRGRRPLQEARHLRTQLCTAEAVQRGRNGSGSFKRSRRSVK